VALDRRRLHERCVEERVALVVGRSDCFELGDLVQFGAKPGIGQGEEGQHPR
jgi:hypothetical protein